MKVSIDWDEMFPVYFEAKTHKEVEIELTKEEDKFFRETMENFEKVQTMIGSKVNEFNRAKIQNQGRVF
jgi:hypothetical protein